MILRSVVLASLVTIGCAQTTSFMPASGQQSIVTNGESLGLAVRLSPPRAREQSFLVIGGVDGRTEPAGEGLERTVIEVQVTLVNDSPQPAGLDRQGTVLEIGGRTFTPLEDGTPVVVPPDSRADLEVAYDLGSYDPRTAPDVAPPIAGGIPLDSINAFRVRWKVDWQGQERTGMVRFVRPSRVVPRWVYVPGPYTWGYGWHAWPLEDAFYY